MEEKQDNNKVTTTKKETKWDQLIHFIFSHKRYVLTLFPIVLVSILLGSMCSSLQKNGHTVGYILCLIGTLLLLGVSMFLVTITKKQFVKNNVSTNVYISIILAYMFLSGFILMIFYKILSMVNTTSIFNITGLTSVIVITVYILLVIASFYIDFDKVINKLKRKKKQ